MSSLIRSRWCKCTASLCTPESSNKLSYPLLTVKSHPKVLITCVFDILRRQNDIRRLETAATWALLLPYFAEDEDRRRTASHLLISTALLSGHGSAAYLEVKELNRRVGCEL
ncbi:unnamed protein product [Protopolystoma xenopodis]|uniref:Uncharacterized protein n=1 Tax=Protopolystoma xenopodis TaxID=117903 RepID=A0A3S5BPA2_9PLAT|nr:unnamed protein product [Protopolystoma xenopodis]